MLLFLKNLLFTTLVPGTVGMYVPVFVLAHAAPNLGALSVAGGLLLLLGASIYAWCLWDFAAKGRVTPAPIDPPKVLVVRGLYRYARNPMYVGVLALIGGWALLFGAPNIAIYGVCVAAVFHLFVVLYEEPKLRRTFGTSYQQYCSEVGRWLPLGTRRPEA